MRARRMGMAATAAGLALVLAGCGGDAGGGAKKQKQQAGASGGPSSASSQQTPQVSQAGVQWMGGFCGSMMKFISATKSAQSPKSQDPAAIQQAVSDRLGSIASGAKTLLTDLEKIEPSPIKGGDKLVSNAADSYSQMLASAKKAKSTVESAPSSDKQAVMQAVKTASSEFKKASQKGGPFQQLQSNKKLAQAFQKAPQCKQLAQAAQPKRPPQGQPGAGRQPAPSPGN